MLTYHRDTNTSLQPYKHMSHRPTLPLAFVLLALLIVSLASCGNAGTGGGNGNLGTASGGGGSNGTPAVISKLATATRTPLHPTPSPTRSTITGNPVQTPTYDGWNAAVIGLGHPGAIPFWHVDNYALAGHHTVLLAQPPYLSPSALLDGVSPDGKNLLYQFSNGGHTLYYTLTPIGGTGFFYELPDASAGRALWLSDSRHVLVLSTGAAVMEVDTQTGTSTKLLSLPLGQPGPPTQIGEMTFVHNNYLYFVGSQGACDGTLCRVALGTADSSVQRISFRSLNATYWLSPDGSTIYFANMLGPAGEPGLYAVNSDGTQLRLLRRYTSVTPVGYAADAALEVLRVTQGKFELVKLGATPQQDQVVLDDVAPGAANLCHVTDLPGTNDICNANVALAPYGHALVVLAAYSNTTYQLWSSDLTTGKQYLLMKLGDHDQAQLPGWDRLPTS